MRKILLLCTTRFNAKKINLPILSREIHVLEVENELGPYKKGNNTWQKWNESIHTKILIWYGNEKYYTKFRLLDYGVHLKLIK